MFNFNALRATMLVALFLPAGCGPSAGYLEMRDSGGQLLSTGHIDFPKAWPPGEFEGTWELTSQIPGIRSHSTGNYLATTMGHNFYLNLSPNGSDVILSGPMTRHGVSGTWTRSTANGGRVGGTFILGLPRGAPH